MPSPPEQRPPIAVAMEWVGRIFVLGIEMVLPGLAGQWLDAKFGTTPWITLVGFGLGLTLAIMHLVFLSAPIQKNKK